MINNLLTYNEWLDSTDGYHAASGVYLLLAASRPTKFEIDKHLRVAYNAYIKDKHAHTKISG
jgi:hypothetical protein